MSDFHGTRLLLHAPLESALRNGRSTYGTTIYTLTDDDVQKVPPDLRDELRIWIEDLAAGGFEDGPPPTPLEIDTPDTKIETIVAALRREASARRERAITEWIFADEKEWFGPTGEPVPAVAAILDDRGIAAMLKGHQAARAERKKAAVAAEEGLRSYALSIPDLARAAREKYDVRVAALEHYVGTIARFDEDAMTFRAGTPEYDNSKSEERRAPTSHAFSVLDAVTNHVNHLAQPPGVRTDIGRIQRFRRAVMKEHRGSKKWGLDEPVTAVMVTVTSYVAADRIVVFLADEDDRQRVRRGKIFADEVPF